MNRTKRSPLFLMALTLFIDFAGFGIVLPLLPSWVERLGTGPAGVGLVLIIYALSAGSLFALAGPGAPFLVGCALVVLATVLALPALAIKHEDSLTHCTPDVQTVSFEKMHSLAEER